MTNSGIRRTYRGAAGGTEIGAVVQLPDLEHRMEPHTERRGHRARHRTENPGFLAVRPNVLITPAEVAAAAAARARAARSAIARWAAATSRSRPPPLPMSSSGLRYVLPSRSPQCRQPDSARPRRPGRSPALARPARRRASVLITGSYVVRTRPWSMLMTGLPGD